jgi:hypothetical protein
MPGPAERGTPRKVAVLGAGAVMLGVLLAGPATMSSCWGRIAPRTFARLRQRHACLKGAAGKQRFRHGLGRLEDRPARRIGQADLVTDHPVPAATAIAVVASAMP